MTLFMEPFAPLFELTRQVASNGVRSFVPAADVVVTDDNVTVLMDVPGLKPDDVTVELREDVLTIRGERSMSGQADTDSENGRQVWQRLERGFGKFERILRLPDRLDANAISASMTDGVLTLHIPKPQERKPRRIEIGTGQKSETIEGTAVDQRELAGAAA